MANLNTEALLCEAYIKASSDEVSVRAWLANCSTEFSLIVVEGFEERSIGFLRAIASAGRHASSLVLLRYSEAAELNKRFRPEFERLAEVIAPDNWRPTSFGYGIDWLREIVESLPGESVVLDISGLGSRDVFTGLDAMAESRRNVYVAYSEATNYHPTKAEWEELVDGLVGDVDEESLLAEKVDGTKWLYSGTHHVELIVGHEGYDAAGVNALVAFLPFKCARLGTLLNDQDYSAYRFIAGKPRLPENSWRLDALKRINATLLSDHMVIEMETFGYRKTLRALAEEICSDKGLLQEFDVHLAPMGSKLQKVACWALSSLLPSITVVSSVTHEYYPEAFSDGAGETWVFPLTKPKTISDKLRNTKPIVQPMFRRC